MLSGQEQPIISEQQAENLKSETRGIVPFLTRNAESIKMTLDQNATGRGFINHPIYTYLEFGLREP